MLCFYIYSFKVIQTTHLRAKDIDIVSSLTPQYEFLDDVMEGMTTRIVVNPDGVNKVRDFVHDSGIGNKIVIDDLQRYDL